MYTVQQFVQFLLTLGWLEHDYATMRKVSMWLHENGVHYVTVGWSNKMSPFSFYQPLELGGKIVLSSVLWRQVEIVHALAHEVRHAWQHEYNRAIFSDYPKGKPGVIMMDLTAHDNHPSEIDAEAWADEVLAAYIVASLS